MRFDLEWLQEQLVNPPEADVLADRLTACGLLVETREAAGDSEIWDIEVTTNRPDSMNHRGLAREAAAATNCRLKPTDVDIEESDEDAAECASVDIADPDLCRRYVARVIRGVEIVESPEWLKQRLERCGVRPINAVVDATNFVLLELGQPLHAFDLDLLEQKKIVVRRAVKGEKLTTLDGGEHKLDPEMLVIADATRPVALAGIMGGADSEINENTADILLESAHFDALSVRRTARRLGMHTEASHRFERGADPEIASHAADAAAALIASLTGGTVCRGCIDNYPRPWSAHTVSFDADRLSAFAGLDIDRERALRILEDLEFTTTVDGSRIECAVPSFRIDIELTADLYEEVIRHVGYDVIPARLPVLAATPGQRNPNWELVDRGREAAAGAGLAEVMTYSFIDPDADRLAASSPLCPGEPIALDNPLAQTQAIMRRSLLPGLLSAARESLSHGERSLALFEQGRVFASVDGGVKEAERLAVALSGSGIGWGAEATIGFSHLKGVVEEILRSIGYDRLTWRRGGEPWLVESEGTIIENAAGQAVGTAGLLSPKAASPWDLRSRVYVAELDLDAALPAPPVPTFKPLPRFPAVTTDMTVEHRHDLAYADIRSAIGELAGELVDHVEFVTRYVGDRLARGMVRTTVRVVYRHPDRSLTQDEVNTTHEELRQKLAQKLTVSLA